MRKFEGFLFIWNIIVITVLLVLWGVKSPSLLNFVSILLLLPSFVYFWIRLSSPESTKFSYWTKRIVAIVVFLILTILTFIYLLSQVKQKELETQFNSAQEEIAKLKSNIKEGQEIKEENIKLQEDVAKLKDELRDVKVNNTANQLSLDITEVLSESTASGSLQTKDAQELDVLEKPISGSRRVGTIVKSETYEYINSENGWYEINLDNGLSGWVRGEDVNVL